MLVNKTLCTYKSNTCGIQSTDTCISSKTNAIIMLDLDEDQGSY